MTPAVYQGAVTAEEWRPARRGREAVSVLRSAAHMCTKRHEEASGVDAEARFRIGSATMFPAAHPRIEQRRPCQTLPNFE